VSAGGDRVIGSLVGHVFQLLRAGLGGGAGGEALDGALEVLERLGVVLLPLLALLLAVARGGSPAPAGRAAAAVGGAAGRATAGGKRERGGARGEGQFHGLHGANTHGFPRWVQVTTTS